MGWSRAFTAPTAQLCSKREKKKNRALWRWIKKSFCRIFPLWVTVRLAVLQEEMREDVGLTPTGSAGMREGKRKCGSSTWNEDTERLENDL